MDEEITRYFEGKPETLEVFTAISGRLEALGPLEVTVGSQISVGVTRKFAWFWLYNVTKKNPNGILHTTLRTDQRIEDPHIRAITQISANRWNHQIVIRSLSDANSVWLGRLLDAAYRFGSAH